MEKAQPTCLSLRVILLLDNGWWIAQGLEWDLAAQGRTVFEALDKFQKNLATQLCLCLEFGFNPQERAIPAPEFYFKLFEHGLSVSKPNKFVPESNAVPEAWMIDAFKSIQINLYA